ncbi:glyoxalase domain-containing protein 4 [Neocloeon triangulifer]|uniref:glyoxalase domain-containing protein 4 n=1 Tax=Neocloeon triangulifer TaxID=2078957 RepID=UPI00286F848D|nr:glyoxalase domain-containing protein 4 [Neocloeon triangulifer]XP_059484444.1 glyoxalase domain-containing protein 4 [Neocloeon triangulifer]
MNINGRALHFVFKIGDRKNTMKFYREVLGMKVLRHEEFTEGCEAACNGPYANRWSKTMIGYGSEDTHFVAELTFNYGVSEYEKGNDFIAMTIKSKEAIERAKALDWPVSKDEASGFWVTEAPGGYKFLLIDEPQPVDTDPVQSVILGSSNLQKSLDFWHGTLGLKLLNKDEKSAVVSFGGDQAKLELRDLGGPVERAKAYGRIAFSCPYEQQEVISKKISETGNTILTPLITLPTPGKATVRVIILADPDGHEICFVGDEGYRQLSEYDPLSTQLLEKAMSKEWGPI